MKRYLDRAHRPRDIRGRQALASHMLAVEQLQQAVGVRQIP
jgi:hypothetical protein